MANIVFSFAHGRIRSEWIIIFEAVIFQRDKTVIGNHDIRALLQRRLEYWSKKEFVALLEDAERCARQLNGHHSTPQDSSEDRIAIFARLVSQNKSSAALRHLLQEDTGGVLDPDECAHDKQHPNATVEEILRLKHPPARLTPAEAFLEMPKDDNGEELPLPTMMDVTGTAELVEKVARKMQSKASGGGPGSLDSSSWTAMLLHFGKDSEKLREAVAHALERIANTTTPWEDIRALCANRLVALDKKPGVRPIGVSHVLRRVLAKCMVALTKADIEEVCGNEQLCAGASNGTEAAIHAMSSSYIKSCLRRAEQDDADDMEDAVGEQQRDGSAESAPTRDHQQRAATDDGVEERKGPMDDPAEAEARGFLKVDADNAFNQCSIAPALWHARRFWPRCARFLHNTYRGHTTLVLYKPKGKPSILHREDGVTQGDPLAMLLYGLGQLPLIRSLRDSMGEDSEDFIQAWLADDSSAHGTLPDLVRWFTLLKEEGPKFGYYAKPVKSTVVVEYKHAEEAHACFDPLGVPVSAGTEYLGGFIGFPGSFEQQNYLTEKIAKWEQAVVLLAEVAKQVPQAAYVVMTKCLYPRWEYTQRVTSFPNSSDHLFADLGKAITEQFIPALFGEHWKEQPLGTSTCQEQHLRSALYGLPLRYGGLGLPPPEAYSRPRHASSRNATRHLVESIIHPRTEYSPTLHQEESKAATRQFQVECRAGYQRIYQGLLGHEHMPADLARAVQRAREHQTHGFLTVQPAVGLNFDLSRNEFRDGLAIRYLTEVIDLPATCDGCGEAASLSHGLHCHKGNLPTRRHNEICDFLVGLCQQAWGGICAREPIIRMASGEQDKGMLKGDFVVRGVWETELVTYFDTRVVDTDAASYLSRPVAAKLLEAEKEKVKKYADACREIRASFTPFVISTDGALAPQASHFLRHLARRLAQKWRAPPATALGWVRPRLSCALVRACSQCIRGPRNALARRPEATARVDFVSDGVALAAASAFVSS
jgi:hypothetical protein